MQSEHGCFFLTGLPEEGTLHQVAGGSQVRHRNRDGQITGKAREWGPGAEGADHTLLMDSDLWCLLKQEPRCLSLDLEEAITICLHPGLPSKGKSMARKEGISGF